VTATAGLARRRRVPRLTPLASLKARAGFGERMSSDFDIFAKHTLEVHTTELTASCLKSVQLRHEGKVLGETGEALFKGVVGHEVLQRMHLQQDIGTDTTLASWAIAQQKKENMPCSDSVRTNAIDYVKEVLHVTNQYRLRLYENTITIGCELPVRATIEIDGEEVNFASHIDWLGKVDGVLTVRDWKFREERATRPYMQRNMQMAAYWWVLRNGQVNIGGQWFTMQQDVQVELIDMWNLKPYGKKTNGIDDNGEPREFQKGDTRPLHSIVSRGNFKDEGAFVSEFATRVRMMRAGLWPTNPDPQGCMTCQSRTSCPAFGWEDDNEIV
jgi:hypothetical protein